MGEKNGGVPKKDRNRIDELEKNLRAREALKDVELGHAGGKQKEPSKKVVFTKKAGRTIIGEPPPEEVV